MKTTLVFSLGILLGMLDAYGAKAPSTLGQPTYPSSGSTRNRTDLMGGSSSAARTSNTEGLIVPTETPSPTRQEQQEKEEEAFKIGPYNEKGEYQYVEPKD